MDAFEEVSLSLSLSLSLSISYFSSGCLHLFYLIPNPEYYIFNSSPSLSFVPVGCIRIQRASWWWSMLEGNRALCEEDSSLTLSLSHTDSFFTGDIVEESGENHEGDGGRHRKRQAGTPPPLSLSLSRCHNGVSSNFHYVVEFALTACCFS
jgi:hypothetical protein